MLKKPLLRAFLAVALAVGFIGGLSRLFVLRYQVGDIYPPYSSLRADPLGTKALATALEELPKVNVRRNFKALPRMRTNGPVTLVYAGVGHEAYWTDAELLAFNTLVSSGSRAVFTFFPVETPPTAVQDKLARAEEHKKKQRQTAAENSREKKTGAKEEKKTAAPAKDQKPPAEDQKKAEDEKSDAADEERSRLIDFSTVAKRWGFDFGYLPEEKGKAYYRHAALIEPGGHMESDISWHSALYFRNLKPSWKVLYMCGTMPVIIERQYGSGSIVLVADSFLISNEALRGERHPRLISRLFAGPATIIFDEEHNQLRENTGIASLVRKYRLYGVVAGLLLLAILFVWENMVRFIPAYVSAATESNVVTGKESGEGFVNLLRRSIRPSAILGVCLAEWRQTFTGRVSDLIRVEEIWSQQEARPPRDRDPLATYRAISRASGRKT